MSKRETQKQGRVLMLPIDSIEPSPYQARTAFDEPEIAALAVSILQNGLLQPISVRRVGLRKYQLVAGERRLRACRLAKLEKIPALLADYDDTESAALGLLENLQRSQLDPFDTARGIKEVIRLWGCTQAEAARRLGLSQPALANKLRLLTLTPEQQDLCTANHLSERHARAVLRLPEGRRTAALEKIARDNLSVRQTDKLVESMLAAPKGPSPCRKTIPMVRDVRFFVNTLQHAVDLMTQKGIAATTSCDKKDGCLEYIVRIPVGSDGRVAPGVPSPAPAAAAAPAASPAPGPVAEAAAVPAAAPANTDDFAVQLL
ncbi:ParB/RepB/Spo0J family partition protein [Subdoligranulum variabile]|uniref:ParB/RepB/Spo0J family partition protein n=1 Tax=Subdoligranulum variabile TaxID=214851 RepID=UPI0026F18B09|nr:ParB/RepB/Spo0J family partition protein [Subdoligranulum variabile]